MDEKLKQIHEMLITMHIEEHLQAVLHIKKLTAERVDKLDEMANSSKKAFSEIFNSK